MPDVEHWESEKGVVYHDKCRPEGPVVLKIMCDDAVSIVSEGR